MNRSWVPRPATAAVAAVALGAAAAAYRRSGLFAAISEIPAELRSPLLPFVCAPYNGRTLPLLRPAFRLPRWSGRAVTVTTRHTTGTPGVRLRVTVPSRGATRRPVVLWFHSGGMIAGSPQFEGPMAGHLARELDAVVVSPDYRVAPENPFPAALDDCMATLRWVIESADELGIDPHRIAAAGASAGGGLAAALAQRCFDERIALRAQALLYPMLDDRTAVSPGAGGLVWSAASNRFAWAAYLGSPSILAHAPQYAAAARRTELAGLPPAWLAVGERDILYPEALSYATRLQAAGVPCEFVVVPGMYHAADLLVPTAASIKALHRGLVGHLKTHLA